MRIEKMCSKIRYLRTDEYKIYGDYKLAETHIQSKSETSWVESFKLFNERYAARLNQKTQRLEALKCSD